MKMRALWPFAAVCWACGASVTLDELRECPKDWTGWQVFADSLHIPPAQAAAMQETFPGPITDVPEFHDCQRFVVVDDQTDREVFGGRFAIFADFRLDCLECNLDTLDQRERAQEGGSLTTAVPAALIVAERDYDPLKVKEGFNCLLLYQQDGAWKAKMAPTVGQVDCLRALDPTTVQGEELRVVPSTPPTDDVPPVARWDWDDERKQHYIGVKCGSAWCEIGNPDGFGQSPTYAGIIKGWYDEQRLAVSDGSGLTPGMWARIIPDPLLGDYVVSDFTGTWTRVARVGLRGDPGPYKAKLNFDDSPSGDPVNTIYLCHGTKEDCGPTDGTFPSCDGGWWARIDGTGGPVYRCVTRCDIPGVEVPGTARWRWSVEDEGIWVRCSRGCCEVILPGGD